MKNYFARKIRIAVLLAVFTLLTVSSVSSASAQTTTVKVQPSNSQPNVGATITVDITITNVQNLFGVDMELSWDPTVLKVLSATSFLGVESHSGGVLHGTIGIAENQLTQQTYNLAGTSEGAATPAFSGNGKIATLTFSVLRSGQSPLTLITELADKPASSDDTSQSINHTDVSGSINTIVPEFPTVIGLIVLLILASASLVFAKKHTKKN